MTDHELLDQYVRHGSRDALNELAERHLDWVYSAALRQVRGDSHLAEDVTQAVFLVLAKKARSINRNSLIGGWLFRACRYAAADARRQAARRSRIESRAAMMKPEMTPTTESHDDAAQWAQLTPLLDESLAQLRQTDREAVILRYYQGKSHGEVGAAQGVSEEAAKKRVARAVDKLGDMLRGKGATGLAPAALPGLLAANATGAAPSGLLASATSPSGSAIAQAVLAGMTWAKLKLAGAIAAMFVIALPIGLLVTHAMGRDRATPPRGEASAALAAVPAAAGAATTTEVVRWHVVVDAALAPAVEALGKAEPTTGKQAARRVSGAEMLALIRKGMADRTVRVVPDRVKWLDPKYPFDSMTGIAHLGGTDDDMTRDTRAYGLSGDYKLTQTPAGVTVSANYANPFDNLLNNDHASIAFNGTISDGEAVAFLGPESKSNDGRSYRTLLVLQAVACPSDAAPFLRTLEDGAKWFEGGAAAALREARAGSQRIASAERTSPSRDTKRWTKTYSDGSTARLVAIGEPGKRPHVWWDGDGLPVKADPFWHTATAGEPGHAVVVEFKPGRPTPRGTISSGQFAPVDLSTGTPRIECGMGIGEWKTAGKVTVDQPLTANDVTFKLNPITHYDYRTNVRPPYNTVVRVNHNAPRDVEVRVQLIDPKGKILGSTNGDWHPLAWRSNLVMNQASGYFNVKPSDVKTAVISMRKREWMTIEGFALTPVEAKGTTQPNE